MRIALLTNGIWPYVIGGMQKHSYFLAKYLARNKVEVVLIHTNQQSQLDINKLEYFSDEEKKYLTAYVVPTPQTPYFPGHYVYRSYLYSKAVFNCLKQVGNVDFIIAKSTTAWYMFRKGDRMGAPVGINIHGYEFMQRKANFRTVLEGWMLKWPFVYVNNKADYVFSYGGKITELIRKLGVSDNKIIELPAGIEEDWIADAIKPTSGIRRFVFVGRFERRKGIQELQEVIKKLHGYLCFEFHFIGPIPEELQLKLPGVKYHGSIRDKEPLQQVLQASHVLVCPSYAEGMPNVILEGMANGCSVIATDVGAVNHLVDETVGWLIPPADKNQLEDAIRKAVSIDDSELDQLRKNGLQRIRDQYTWDTIAKSTIAALQERIGA
ncbi:MAG TPA: glycosyltransferase family 4 protein [Parasegetibacter sp.]